MQKDTRTEARILPSSLCKRMEFTLPESWDALTDEQLEYVLRMLWLYSGAADMLDRVKVAVMVKFLGIRIDSLTDAGYLCEELATGKTFILDPGILPSMLQPLGWVEHPEDMGVRLETVGGYRAVDFELRELMFGEYLIVENLYQGYLVSKKEELLVRMSEVLYHIPDGGKMAAFREHILLGVLLWWMAAKKTLSEWFPNFLKPAAGDGVMVTRETLVENMRIQLRLLTKGDVTKEEYIKNNVDTWTAMSELDAQAREAEEIRRKYGRQEI